MHNRFGCAKCIYVLGRTVNGMFNVKLHTQQILYAKSMSLLRPITFRGRVVGQFRKVSFDVLKGFYD